MTKTILILICLSALGCTSATMISEPGGSGSKYAPSNDDNRTGTIKYLNQGAGFVVDSRREDAYKQMYSSCNGKYSIVSEGPRAEGGSIVPMGNAAIFSQSEYWYINFKCDGPSRSTAQSLFHPEDSFNSCTDQCQSKYPNEKNEANACYAECEKFKK